MLHVCLKAEILRRLIHKTNISALLERFSIWFIVSTLKEQLEDMRKISQNSQASNDKIIQLQNQVSCGDTCTACMRGSGIHIKLYALFSRCCTTVGGGQRPPACGVRHSSKVTEEPHGNGQVDEPARELEPWAAGEEPCHRWWKGPAGEGGPANSKQPGLGEEELQPGIWGDQGASRWVEKSSPTLKCQLW